MTNWKVLPISAWHCRPVTDVTGRQSLSPCQGCLLRERPGIFARMASFSLSLRVSLLYYMTSNFYHTLSISHFRLSWCENT